MSSSLSHIHSFHFSTEAELTLSCTLMGLCLRMAWFRRPCSRLAPFSSCFVHLLYLLDISLTLLVCTTCFGVVDLLLAAGFRSISASLGCVPGQGIPFHSWISEFEYVPYSSHSHPSEEAFVVFTHYYYHELLAVVVTILLET
jgi:hypothetical protein